MLISAASGATGSMAVQIANHVLKASKVIGIAGSDEKCKWVESLGADCCVNYKDADWKEKLSDYIGTDYVDVYFDNVGGEILSFALNKVARYGTVIAWELFLATTMHRSLLSLVGSRLLSAD